MTVVLTTGSAPAGHVNVRRSSSDVRSPSVRGRAVVVPPGVDPTVIDALVQLLEVTDRRWRLGASPAQALAAVEAGQVVAAFTHWASAVAVETLRDAIEIDLDADASQRVGPTRLASLADDADQATVAELAAATGWSTTQCWRRLRQAHADRDRHRPVLERLRLGTIGPETAHQLLTATSGCLSEDVAGICDRVLAPVRGSGAPPSYAVLARRLRVEVARLDQSATVADRERAVDARGLWAEVHPDGSGTMTITGTGQSIVAAAERIDAAARAARAAGDARTLPQLRSDLAVRQLLDAVSDTGVGPAAPPARVSVVVALTTLLGLDEGIGELPGYGFVTGSHVREVAMAHGSVWRRLVTDRAGQVIDVSPYRYRPDASTSRLVITRDAVCRGPGCTHPAARCDLDHRAPWPDGATTAANLAAVHRGHHNLKTRQIWHAVGDADDPDLMTWHTRAGRQYATRPHDYLAELLPPPDPPPF